jgi:hypothetical protein
VYLRQAIDSVAVTLTAGKLVEGVVCHGRAIRIVIKGKGLRG